MPYFPSLGPGGVSTGEATLNLSLTELLVPTFTQTLQSMSKWVDKARENAPAIDVQALFSARIAPDMYPLASQIRFACFQAQEPLFRLRGEPLPDSLLRVRGQGWNPESAPNDVEHFQACIHSALERLQSLPKRSLDAAATSAIALDLPNGIVFDLTGETYARDWALPQFYFHATMAYAILRSNAVPLGKADYVSHMFPYLRPGTMPTS